MTTGRSKPTDLQYRQPMRSRVKQETVTLETLSLLTKTVDYLKRLPAVPVTRDLIKEIEHHLADPSVLAARREAEAADLLSSKRVAQSFGASGQLRFEAVVEGSTVTIKVPPNTLPPGQIDRRMEQLADGVAMDLEPPRTS